MAIGIENLPNITPSGTGYPNGALRDKTISVPGTAVNKLSFDDIFQTFAKFLRLSNTTASNTPDNETNGFQYVTAMTSVLGNNRRVYAVNGIATSHIAEADYNELVVINATALTGQVVSLNVPTSPLNGKIVIANYSTHNVDVYDYPSANTINGASPPFTLAGKTYIEFTYNGSTNWTITSKYLLD
jgi:hypothetical protein